MYAHVNLALHVLIPLAFWKETLVFYIVQLETHAATRTLSLFIDGDKSTKTHSSRLSSEEALIEAFVDVL